MKLIRILKDFALFWAMLVGAFFYPWLWRLAPLCTYTLFVMLLLSYTKIKPSDIEVTRTHVIMFIAQWILGIISYIVIEPFDPLVATGVAMLILTPTATAASVITGMLGGNIAFVTTYMIASNIAIALIGPVLISAVHPNTDGNYWAMVLAIFGKVSTLLILPLVIAWGVRYLLPKVHDKMIKLSSWTFWIWAFNIMVLMGSAIHTFVTSEQLTIRYTGLLVLITMMTTLALYFLGGRCASWTRERVVNGRQTLGQKNTVFAIWLAITFLDPKVAFIPTLYIITQNIINSLELAVYRRNNGTD